MSTDTETTVVRRFLGTRPSGSPVHFIPVIALGMGLSLFLALSYILCILAYVFVPGVPITHSALTLFLPGFTLLSWTSLCLGLIESFAWGWYVALVFGPIYNFFAAR